MKKVKLDQDKLLGFKILRQTPKIGGKPVIKTGTKLGAKLGAKVGGKP